MKYLISTTDPVRLKHLFPNLIIVKTYPEYTSAVYSTFDYSGPEFFLLESSQGINVDNHSGLALFLKEINYFRSETKLLKFQERSYPQDTPVSDLYKDCSLMRLCNRWYTKSPRDEVDFFLDIFSKDFYTRISYLEERGWKSSFKYILELIERYYSKGQMSASLRSRLSELFSRVRFSELKKDLVVYNPEGGFYSECCQLLTYFG
jgi:hypothetical protein